MTNVLQKREGHLLFKQEGGGVYLSINAARGGGGGGEGGVKVPKHVWWWATNSSRCRLLKP